GDRAGRGEREQEEGAAAEKRGARAGAELVRSGALDQEADACARRREADQQRQVRVRVQDDRHRAPVQRDARLPVEVKPPEGGDRGEAERRRCRGLNPRARAGGRGREPALWTPRATSPMSVAIAAIASMPAR